MDVQTSGFLVSRGFNFKSMLEVARETCVRRKSSQESRESRLDSGLQPVPISTRIPSTDLTRIPSIMDLHPSISSKLFRAVDQIDHQATEAEARST